MHPARAYVNEHGVGGLLMALDVRVAKGLIKRKDHGDLALFHYSEECMYTKAWDDITLMARGLIIDTKALELVATPFPKFFNYGERLDHKLPEEPFIAFEKLDGSLGITFQHKDEWHMATKGSFTSTQAVEGLAMLRQVCTDGHLGRGFTYLFEIVGPWNRIIVPYAKSELVLLAAYDENHVEIVGGRLEIEARQCGVRLAKRHEGKTIDDLVEIAKALPRDDEGFVVRFESGYRVKIKGAAYVRAHKLASRVTPLGVYDALVANDDLQALRRELPEELWTDFDAIHALLWLKVLDRSEAIARALSLCEGRSVKEIGLCKDVPENLKWAVFAKRNGKEIFTDPKLRRTFFEAFRPTGNVLKGYSPSNSLFRFQET
jgi:RNA ligase